MDDIYKGYKLLETSTNEINDYIENINPAEWSPNEYLVVKNTDDGSEFEMRWTGERLVQLKLPPSKVVKGKNALQRCALDMLNNPAITICAVLGGYGTGKTCLSLLSAKYQVLEKGNQSKILGLREPIGHGKQVGYLKGDFSDKTDMFFLPLQQQLDGGQFELESLKQRGVIEANIIYYLKGTTYNDTIILCDEAEDLDESQLRLVGTRVGDNGRIFLTGDFRQGIYNRSLTNPLVKMCKELRGSYMFGCVVMEEDVRSETSKLFANLFQE